MRAPEHYHGAGALGLASAGICYFVLVFLAGTLLGVVRTLWLAPQIGALAAVGCEIPVMLVIVWMSSKTAMRAFRVPKGDRRRVWAGAIAFILLQLAEAAMALVVFRMDGAAYWKAIASPAGALGLAAQLFVLWAPVLEGRVRPAARM